MGYILSYDLGTGGTKACLYQTDGKLLRGEFVSVDTFFPRERFHEQRPQDWFESVVGSTKALLASTGIKGCDVLAIALSGHSLGVVPVSANGELLSEFCPIWSDARANAQAERFFQTIDEPSWYETTGCGFPAPLYAVFKMMWLKDEKPDLYERAQVFLGTKDYVNFRLTGRFATDHSYASGSGVYDLKKRAYREDYIAASGIDADKLPCLLESSDVVGCLTQEAAELLHLPQSVRVVAGGVDNACMVLGAACTRDGMAYTSLGTSAWIAVASHEPIVSRRYRSYVFAHCIPGMFTSATSIFSAGNSLRWAKNRLCPDLETQARQDGADVYDLITALAATSPVGARKAIFNPSLAGGSACEKSPNITGAFLGLTLSHTREDLLRAVLEGIAMNLRISMDILSSLCPLTDEMLIVGGGAKSAVWRQIFADNYEKTILQSSVGQDCGSLGAMACACVGLGLWDSYDLVSQAHAQSGSTAPIQENVAVYDRIRPVFIKAAEMQSDLGDLLATL